jgi:DNA polymerase
MFVGERPGRTDDETGEPYSGRTGEMLAKLLRAMGYARDEVYLSTVVECHAEAMDERSLPPGDGWRRVQTLRYKGPSADAIHQCSPFLKAQIVAVRPLVIVAFGNLPLRSLTGTTAGIEMSRGRWIDVSFEDVQVKVMPTYSLQYVMKDPSKMSERKSLLWRDMQQVIAHLRG